MFVYVFNLDCINAGNSRKFLTTLSMKCMWDDEYGGWVCSAPWGWVPRHSAKHLPTGMMDGSKFVMNGAEEKNGCEARV